MSIKNNNYSSSDKDQVETWLKNSINGDLSSVVDQNLLPSAGETRCTSSELNLIKSNPDASTLGSLHPACIADIMQLLFETKWPRGNLFGVFVYKKKGNEAWSIQLLGGINRKICTTIPSNVYPFMVCIFVTGRSSPPQTAEFSAKLPHLSLSQALSLIPKIEPESKRSHGNKNSNFDWISIFHFLVSLMLFFVCAVALLLLFWLKKRKMRNASFTKIPLKQLVSNDKVSIGEEDEL